LSRETVTASEEQTEEAGRLLAGALSKEDVVYLDGDLGSGKTCFARGVARGLGAAVDEVASPTFAIVNEYASPSGEIVLRHLDLYRLEDSPRELEALGLPESVRGAPVLVEWPKTALRDVLPPTREVAFSIASPVERRLRFRP
jgi:tRNA threonylcarbamoyladenosine biosynthesis protein TsaE